MAQGSLPKTGKGLSNISAGADCYWYRHPPRPLSVTTLTSPITRHSGISACGRSTITRRKGIALFRYDDKVGGADVIFGEEGDSLLLGACTLEALGLALDPLRRELKPLPMILSGKIS
jgi:hypothetical protein